MFEIRYPTEILHLNTLKKFLQDRIFFLFIVSETDKFRSQVRKAAFNIDQATMCYFSLWTDSMFTNLITLFSRALPCFGMVIAFSLSFSEPLTAQTLPTLPDSSYVHDEIIIWFNDGYLNKNYLGCMTLGKHGTQTLLDQSLPLSTQFIFSESVVSFLLQIGVLEIRKMIPAINPCSDTISIAKDGQTLYMPHYWNALVIKFHTPQNIAAIAYSLVGLFQNEILWAQPNFLYFPLDESSRTVLKYFTLVKKEDNPIFISIGKSKTQTSYPLNTGKDRTKILSYTNVPNDSAFLSGGQNGLKGKWPGDASIDSVWWKFSKGDPNIRIGVVDGGFDYRHPDLGGGVGDTFRVRGAWSYDWTGDGPNTYRPDHVKRDPLQHGTSCLSIIGAISNNDSVGVAGICGGDSSKTSGASLYALAATSSAAVSNAVWEASANTGNLPGSGGSNNLWLCDILSFSISTLRPGNTGTYGVDPNGLGCNDEIVRSIMGFRYQNGRSTFCAYGNDYGEHKLENVDTTIAGSPQDVDKEWVTTVSTANQQDMANDHDWGENLDILAPAGQAACFVDSGSVNYFYLSFTGTSCAAPIVAGIAGLLLSYHRELTDPTKIRKDSIPGMLYPEDIDYLLKNAALHNFLNSSSHPFDNQKAWGAVKAYPALKQLQFPYIIKQDSVRFSGSIPQYEEDTLKIVFPGWTRDTTYQPFQGGSTTYKVYRYHLVQNDTIDRAKLKLGSAGIERVWGRGGVDHM